MASLAVDAGQTACRVLLRDGTREVIGEGRGISQGDVVDAVMEIVREILERLAPTAILDHVAVGTTGLHGQAGDAEKLLRMCQKDFSTQRVVIADDCLTSFVGALGLRPGVVIAAGTGVTVLATDGVQNHHKVDGWGHLCGDAGSGYWIGREGLAQALRELDGRGGSGQLLGRLRAKVADPSLLPSVLSINPERVGWIAAFSREVAQAADEGDDVARGILHNAGGLLAESVATAAHTLFGQDEVVVASTGNLFNAGPLLLEPFRERLAESLPKALWRTGGGSSLDGAAYLVNLEPLPELYPLLTSATT